ncbi:MAG: flagellar hook-basal body complex protein FliE [Deltaproteobacteria bacterium]|nr:flagellar hook-basal body complex protein FliE [Deltaproteobacteria bacterium]
MRIPSLPENPGMMIGDSASKHRTDKNTDFVESLKNAIDKTNKVIEDANQASLRLAEGKSVNIHEAMIKMQKADIMLRLLVTSTNKLIQGYNELMRLR